MPKSVVRIVLTLLMYAGVVVFLVPYFTGRVTQGIMFVTVGAIFAVVCGLLRCYLTDGDCTDPELNPHHHMTPATPAQNIPRRSKR